MASWRPQGRGASQPPAAWPPEERRDLIGSACALKSRGIIPVIAEIKPKALGRTLTQEEVAAYAGAYAENNACAISVLTEPTHFQGALENALIARRAGLPVLRKDFIFDERQLSEVQADLVLLIAALGIDLERFVDRARALGMEPLVEVHTEGEMEDGAEDRCQDHRHQQPQPEHAGGRSWAPSSGWRRRRSRQAYSWWRRAGCTAERMHCG